MPPQPRKTVKKARGNPPLAVALNPGPKRASQNLKRRAPRSSRPRRRRRWRIF
jgi:hypothetical protein